MWLNLIFNNDKIKCRKCSTAHRENKSDCSDINKILHCESILIWDTLWIMLGLFVLLCSLNRLGHFSYISYISSRKKSGKIKKNRHRMANARTYLELYNYFPLIGFSLGMEKRADDPSAGQDNRRVWQDVDGGGRPGSDFSCVRN